MFADIRYLRLVYDPVDCFCKVMADGSHCCVITPDVELFRGDYDEVDEWVKKKAKENTYVLDGLRYEVKDERGFRNDYKRKKR